MTGVGRTGKIPLLADCNGSNKPARRGRIVGSAWRLRVVSWLRKSLIG
jgi:hypothetical protein